MLGIPCFHTFHVQCGFLWELNIFKMLQVCDSMYTYSVMPSVMIPNVSVPSEKEAHRMNALQKHTGEFP